MSTRPSTPRPPAALPALNPSTSAGQRAAPGEVDRQAQPSAGRLSRLRCWLRGHLLILLFAAAAFAILALFSGHRFFHQSRAPHFIWQAAAFL